jgi:hypothetical protein
MLYHGDALVWHRTFNDHNAATEYAMEVMRAATPHER